jgi:ABC-2 type transport system ATP-binding protein
MEPALDIRDLGKSYRGFDLRDVSFSLPRGTIMGLVGANGAGKTTVVKLILNLVRRDAGSVRVFGLDAAAEEREVKARIGFVHEAPAMVQDARAGDIARAAAPFYPRWDEGRFRSLAAEFGVPLEKKFKALSHGTKMKLALAIALAHDADLLVLDEPTSGLDPVFRRELLERMMEIIQDENKAVLFSTHITSDLEAAADWITLLHRGRLVLTMPRHELGEAWAMVRGGRELLAPEHRPLFRAVRERAFGVEALTADAAAARASLPAGTVVDRPTIEEILLLLEEDDARS